MTPLSYFQVDYLKLTDWYLICCFIFVISVFIEFAIVLYIKEIQKRKLEAEEEEKKRKDELEHKRMIAVRMRILFYKHQ